MVRRPNAVFNRQTRSMPNAVNIAASEATRSRVRPLDTATMGAGSPMPGSMMRCRMSRLGRKNGTEAQNAASVTMNRMRLEENGCVPAERPCGAGAVVFVPASAINAPESASSALFPSIVAFPHSTGTRISRSPAICLLAVRCGSVRRLRRQSNIRAVKQLRVSCSQPRAHPFARSTTGMRSCTERTHRLGAHVMTEKRPPSYTPAMNRMFASPASVNRY